MSDYDFSVDDILNEFYMDLEENSDSDRKTERPAYSEPQTTFVQEERVKETPNYDSSFDSYRVKQEKYAYTPSKPKYEPPKEERQTNRNYDWETKETKSKTESRYEELAKKQQAWLREDDTSITHLKPQNVKSLEELYAEQPKKKTYREKVVRKQPIYNEPEDDGMAARALRGFFGVIFAILSLILLCWVGVKIHPESETMTFSKANTKADLAGRIDTYSNNSKVDVLSSVEELAEKAVIKKVYKIPENQLVAPEPDKAAYGTVSISEASKVLEVIEQARQSGLLEDQNVQFSADANFYHDSNIQYYYDETILVICWKELVENRVTSLCEVKIADGSQIRRKVCEDTYGSSVYLYCSELAEQANAVVAMNSDYYAFRDLGITCYDRTVYRFNEYNYYGSYTAYNVTDTLFIDENGDFVIFKRGTVTTKDEVQQWVNDNNLLYSIAFGPLMVENYELVDIPDYPVGEINEEYSRAGISQVDNLHYLYMAVSHSNDSTPRCNVHQFAQMFKDRGVKTAYCFDGGQTGELYFNGSPYNYIDWGNERTVSDIIYFATAIGSEATS